MYGEGWAVNLVTAPTQEPVSVDEFKELLGIDASDCDQDDLLSSLITSVREVLEETYDCALLTQTRRLTLDCFPGYEGEIRLPHPPLQSVSSLTYVDTDGATQTLSTSLYRVGTDGEPGRITPAYSECWPDTQEVIEAVKITYVCGYATLGAVPKRARDFIRLAARKLYEGDCCQPSPDDVISAARQLGLAMWSGMRCYRA